MTGFYVVLLTLLIVFVVFHITAKFQFKVASRLFGMMDDGPALNLFMC